jgi:hypothetical protein
METEETIGPKLFIINPSINQLINQWSAEFASAYVHKPAAYTDGSFIQGSTVCASVCDDQLFKYRLHSFNSVLRPKFTSYTELFRSFGNSLGGVLFFEQTP